MLRVLVVAAVLAFAPALARAQTEQQALVDRATLSVQEMFAQEHMEDIVNLLKRAKGAMVCPRVFKAAFFVGGQGGGCVLVGRAANGWSSPAFYGMGAGGFGLQIGVQDSEVIFIVLTDKGLTALMDSQFKIGADASIAVATIGAGIEGATTAAFRADIVAFQQARGLFAGISISGSMIGARSEWNQAYYGRPVAPQQIVLQMQATNPGADPLRATLAKYSGG